MDHGSWDQGKSKKRKYSKQYCFHCRNQVSKSTWYRHYNQFYDPVNDKWEVSQYEQPFKFDSSSDENSEGDSPPHHGLNFSECTNNVSECFTVASYDSYKPKFSAKLIVTVFISLLYAKNAIPCKSMRIVYLQCCYMFICSFSKAPSSTYESKMSGTIA